VIATQGGVTRRDDGLSLRALRVGVHPEALIIHVGTDVVVRTPARPDHHDGNVVDLLAPPDPSEIDARLEGIRRLMEPIGVGSVHLRYELEPDAHDDEERITAFTAAGCERTEHLVLCLDAASLPRQLPAPLADVTIERLEGPDGGVIAGRRWYAAAVLDRYAHGEDVTTWRAWDEQWGGWQRERIGALARAGRAEVWLAARHGMPVATLTLVDDRDGLIVVDDVVTHPAHRARGIAHLLLVTALTSLRGSTPLEQVAIGVRPGSPGEALAAGIGFQPVGTVHAWRRPAGWTAGDRR